MVALLSTGGEAEKLSNKERDGEFYGIKGNAGVGLYYMSLLNHRKGIGGTAFVIDIKDVENLENLALRLAFSRFWHSPYDT